jgi:hypothetical protein
MAPAFDRRSMESYAPVITGVTSELLAQLDVLPNLSEVDVWTVMMHKAACGGITSFGDRVRYENYTGRQQFGRRYP